MRIVRSSFRWWWFFCPFQCDICSRNCIYMLGRWLNDWPSHGQFRHIRKKFSYVQILWMAHIVPAVKSIISFAIVEIKRVWPKNVVKESKREQNQCYCLAWYSKIRHHQQLLYNSKCYGCYKITDSAWMNIFFWPILTKYMHYLQHQPQLAPYSCSLRIFIQITWFLLFCPMNWTKWSRNNYYTYSMPVRMNK